MSPPLEASDELQLIKRDKKVKNTPGPEQRIVCKKLFLRLDKHIETHADRLSVTKWRQFILGFCRCQNAPPNVKYYDCSACFRRFRSLPTHRYGPRCSHASITEVSNPGSRRSLLEEIRKVLKSDVLPSQNDLEIAENFVGNRNQLSVGEMKMVPRQTGDETSQGHVLSKNKRIDSTRTSSANLPAN